MLDVLDEKGVGCIAFSSLAQMALAWLLKDNRITSVLIGASSASQLNNNMDSLQNLTFYSAELEKIENVLE